eukprot:TRINITY_DN1082_c0_g1_i1.p1 TRINITY_DN1082_c0_g1~~TRINITY_DN1082_c0_g1_i1.p1  ORF type:complete len:396 (-),score=86.57 TRINITY_DN1082_c0_g1_i1:8-1195(-)
MGASGSCDCNCCDCSGGCCDCSCSGSGCCSCSGGDDCCSCSGSSNGCCSSMSGGGNSSSGGGFSGGGSLSLKSGSGSNYSAASGNSGNSGGSGGTRSGSGSSAGGSNSNSAESNSAESNSAESNSVDSYSSHSYQSSGASEDTCTLYSNSETTESDFSREDSWEEYLIDSGEERRKRRKRAKKYENNYKRSKFRRALESGDSDEYTSSNSSSSYEPDKRKFVVILDRSGSMHGQLWDQALASLQSIVPRVYERTQKAVNLYLFNHNVLHFKVASQERLEQLIHYNPPNGTTDLARALEQAFLKHYSHGNSLHMLIITDGVPNSRAEVQHKINKMTHTIKHQHELSLTFFQIGNYPAASEFLYKLPYVLSVTGARFHVVDTYPADVLFHPISEIFV